MSKCIVLILLLVSTIVPPVAAVQQSATPAQDLVEYIRGAKKQGLTDSQIEQNAVKAGWPLAAVREGIAKAGPAAAPAGDAKSTGPDNANTAAHSSRGRIPPAENGASSPRPPDSGETSGITKPGVINHGVPDEYHIGEGDVVQISVWGEPTASVASVVVRPDGKITMPLVKDVSVSGLTPAEAEKVITELLSKDLQAPDVTVIVTEINSKKVFMVGAVKKEGPLPYTYRMTVMQAISEAGGLTDYAKRKKIYVLRNENGRQYQLTFNYDAVLKGQHMELNHILQPGDTLVVPH